MVLMLRSLFVEADVMICAGLAGGLLGAAFLRTERSGFCGAVIGACSALFGLVRAGSRCDARFRALEASVGRNDARLDSVDSALEAFGIELAEVDLLARAPHEESSNVPSGDHWMSEDSGETHAAPHYNDNGSSELERQREGFEDFLAIQVARVDNIILGMHSDLRGVAFSHYFRSFQSLAALVGRAETRRREEYALRAGFGVWAGAHRSSLMTAYRNCELVRQSFSVWAGIMYASQRTAYRSGDLADADSVVGVQLFLSSVPSSQSS